MCYERLGEDMFQSVDPVIIEFADVSSNFFNKYLIENDIDEESDSKSSDYAVPIKKAIRKRQMSRGKHRGQRKYESYSNLAKIRFLRKAAGGIITNTSIELKRAKKAASEMGISWSTAKSWVKKHEEYLIGFNKTGMTYSDFLESQGEKLKVGVGRKITYGKEKEEAILTLALKAREEEKPFTIRDLKLVAKKIIGDNFKASDGWAKKFCSRNNFSLMDKFACPKNLPAYFLIITRYRKLSSNLTEFTKEYQAVSSKYHEEQIVFVDGFELDLMLVNRCLNIKKKRDAKAMIMLPISSHGNLLKPLLIMNNSGGMKIKSSEYVNVAYNDLAVIGSEELLKVIKDNLDTSSFKSEDNTQGNKSWLVVIPTYSFLKELGIQLEGMQFVLLPKGLSCILNPLKEILPLFLETIVKVAQNEESVEEMLVKWIEDTTSILMNHYSYILKNAFNNLKITI